MQPGQTIAFESYRVRSAPADADSAECQVAVESSVEAGGGSPNEELIVESGFSTEGEPGSRSNSAGAVITNPSQVVAACEVQVTFSLLDAAGAPVESITETIPWIPKDGRVIVAPEYLLYDGDEDPAGLAVATVVGAFEDTDDLAVCDPSAESSGTLLDASASVHRDGSLPIARGQVTNTSPEVVQVARLSCVLRDGGSIIGGDATDIFDPIKPGQEIAFESSPIFGDVEDADSAECQVAVETSEEAGGDPAAVELLVESGFSTEDEFGFRSSSAGGVVTNPSADVAACEVEVTFSLLDASGTPLETDTAFADWIPKSGRAIVAPSFSSDFPEEPTALSVSVLVGSFVDTDGVAGCDELSQDYVSARLDVAEATVLHERTSTAVTGQLTNELTERVQTGFLNCVLRAGASIIGGNTTEILELLQPGETIDLEADEFDGAPQTADSAECQVVVVVRE